MAAARAEVLNVAEPALSGPEPKVVAPSFNVTVPVGVPLPGAAGDTVAVNFTPCPTTEGFADDTSTVVVPAMFTVCMSVLDVLAEKLLLPPYAALIEWLPRLSVEVLNVAIPPLSVFEPKVVAPSLKVTVPVGVPDPGATALTVAVKVTDWPKTEGFADDATAVVVLSVFTICVRMEEVLVEKLELPP